MTSQELPSDMIFEILIRTTLKTLDRCKCVSKDWKEQIIEESTFMSEHCKRANNVSGFFIQDQRPGGHVSMFVPTYGSGCSSVGSLPRDMTILASCNQGILCCVRRRDCKYRYYVCKPTTGQWQALPNPKLRYLTVAVAVVVMGSNPLRYKIVRLSQKGFAKSKEHYEYHCEIFDSISWTWRKSQTLTLPYLEFIQSSTPSVFVKSSFHWLTTNDNVLAFHEPTESFHVFPLPEPINGCQHMPLMDYHGRLGSSCLTGERKIEVWLLEGDLVKNRVKWRKHMVVDIGSLDGSVMYPSLVGVYDAGIVLLKGVYEVVFHNIRDCSSSWIELENEVRYANEVFQFRSDLEKVCFRKVSQDY